MIGAFAGETIFQVGYGLPLEEVRTESFSLLVTIRGNIPVVTRPVLPERTLAESFELNNHGICQVGLADFTRPSIWSQMPKTEFASRVQVQGSKVPRFAAPTTACRGTVFKIETEGGGRG